MGNDFFCQAAGCQNRCLFADLILYPVYDPVNCRGIAVQNSAFHTINGILSDYFFRRFNADAAELGRSCSECIQGYAHARKDHAAYIIFLIIYHRDCRSRSHIKYNKRNRILCDPCHRICHQIRSKLSRVVHHDVKARLNPRS